MNKDTTAMKVPIIEAGNRTYAFFSEAFAVGSIVTIAVITANMGGRFSHIHIKAVRKVEIPVFIILSPNIFLS